MMTTEEHAFISALVKCGSVVSHGMWQSGFERACFLSLMTSQHSKEADLDAGGCTMHFHGTFTEGMLTNWCRHGPAM